MGAVDTPGTRSKLATFAICAFSGTLAGIVVPAVSVPLQIADAFWRSPWTLEQYFMVTPIWQRVLDTLDLRFVIVPIMGTVGGLLSGVFTRTTRRPIVLASLWASVVGSVTVLLQMILMFAGQPLPKPVEFAVALGVLAAFGGIYGFTLGGIVRAVEWVIDRRRMKSVRCETK